MGAGAEARVPRMANIDAKRRCGSKSHFVRQSSIGRPDNQSGGVRTEGIVVRPDPLGFDSRFFDVAPRPETGLVSLVRRANRGVP